MSCTTFNGSTPTASPSGVLQRFDLNMGVINNSALSAIFGSSYPVFSNYNDAFAVGGVTGLQGWGTPTNQPPAWTAMTFANGVANVVYSQQFDMAPASPTITYTVTAGALPTGLSLSTLSGTVGLLSGTPAIAGSYSFVLASNAYGSASKSFTVVISPPPSSGGGATFF